MNCPHCNIHIDEHEATCCLAKWVAADVMEIVHGEYGEIIMYDHGIYESSEPPDYPNDIAVAWEVVEKLMGDDFWLTLIHKTTVFRDDLDKPGWSARFRCTRAGIRGDHFGASTNQSLAICRAAIKARCSKESVQHKPECWKNQARSYLGVGGKLASCTCGAEDK